MWSPSLQMDGRYCMPTDDRFTSNPISISDSTACLYYNSILIERWAIVDFEMGMVFLYETINGIEVYAQRAVPIDSFAVMIRWRLWEGQIRTMTSARTDRGAEISVPLDNLPPGVQTLIGTGGAGLSVDGSYRITLSGRSEWTDLEYYWGSKWPQLQMEQESNFRITGSIGSKIKVSVDQDSKRETDLENTINIKYAGEEDDVVQLIEAGNTTLNLPGASLVGYSERIQGLFGIKSIFQVGDWCITTIASQEKANTISRTVKPSLEKSSEHDPGYAYRARTYYYIDTLYAYRVYDSGDSIIDFALYISNSLSASSTNSRQGWAFARNEISPSSPPTDTEPSDTVEAGFFEEVSPSEYYINRSQGWFRFNYPANSDDIIGIRYIIQRSNGSIDTVGFFDEGSNRIYLKLIKPESLQPSHKCWDYEWRNVYSLGKQDIDLEETFIQLYWESGADSFRTLPENSAIYLITLYGMDEQEINGDPRPDGYVDQSPYYIDAARGELIFTVPHPFDPQELDIALQPDLIDFPDTLRNPYIYTSTNNAQIEQSSRCFIFSETKGFSSVQDLGAYNIIPGSEEVKLDGVKLQKDVDYTILYEIGQIRFISDKARDPNANIEINFEAQPFFSVQQKTLLGSRLQYDLGEDSWFGVTGLYRSVTTPERRPRIGGEPSRAYMWDVDLRLSQEIPFMTAAVDAIPLIQTDATSNVTLALETAQIISNPNTIGDAYIDDFEGSKSTDPLSITRTMWTPSSVPSDYLDQPRAKVIWYNPYDRVNVTEIWPNREVTSDQSTTDVLRIEFTDTSVSGGAWGGIMQYINPAYQDQQNAQFFEVWIQGDEGVLVINMGKVSEDIDGNGELDTEDKMIADRYDYKLAPEEDTGIDGLWNDEELNYYLNAIGIDTTAFSLAERESMLVDSIGRDPSDPSGDNWSYPDARVYDNINGTEGNIDDPVGLRKPDSEDLNKNGVLNMANDYFEFEIDLASENYMVPNTESAAGWRLYRIPIRDSLFTLVEDGRIWHRTEIGNPDPNFTQIQYVRLGLKDVTSGDATVSIAQIAFVRNQWEEDFDNFEVAVKNSQEDEFETCPDCGGYRDPTTGLTIAEQSLVLKYKHLPPLDTVYAYKTYSSDRAEDYTQYRELTMWVYYDTSVAEGTAPQFFYRMGDNSGNYYEYRTDTLLPGWDENNQVVIDFDEMTAFKQEYLTSDTAISNIRLASHGHGYYVIVGEPTLTKITMLQLGLINCNQNYDITGEVYCDELKVEDVRHEDGMAYKSELSFKAADFFSFMGTVEQRDDDFHKMTETQSASSFSRSYRSSSSTARAKTLRQNYTTTYTLSKFFPIRWGVNLPLAMTYIDILSIPRFITGSDVFLPDSLREKEKSTENVKRASLMGVGVSPTDPSLPVAVFVSPNKMNYSWSKSRKHGPEYLDNYSTTYNVKHIYNLRPRTEAGQVIVKKAEEDSTGKGIGGDIAISYVPSRVEFTTEVNELKTTRLHYTAANYENSFTRSLKHNTALQYKPIPSLTADFSLAVDRDIHMEDWFQLGPPTIFGKGTRKIINDGLTWKPVWLDYLSQTYELKNSYTEDTKNPTEGTFGKATQARTASADYTLKWKELVGKPSGRTGASAESSDGKLKAFLQRLDNLRVKYNWRENNSAPNLAKRPGRAFQFGFTDNPDVPAADTSSGYTSPSKTFTNKLDASTGAKLPYDIHVTTKYNYTSTRSENSSQNTRNVSQTFPDLTAKWGFFKNIGFIKTFSRSTSASSNWSYKWTKDFTNDSLSQLSSENKFSPLFGINFNMKGGWTLDLKYNWDHSVRETHSGSISWVGTDQKKFDLIAKYTLKAEKGIKIPLLGKVSFENNLNLSLTFSYSTRYTENWYEADMEKQKTAYQSVWTLKPEARYRLSRNAEAGIQVEITEDTDKIIDYTRHIRDVRIWVQFQFGGGRSVGGGGFGGSGGSRYGR